MPLTWVRVEQFRCIERAELELDRHFNFFVGPNASGKTSLLEAFYLLGRGRSFRTRRVEPLIQYGKKSLSVVGNVSGATGDTVLGVQARREGAEIRIGGRAAQSAAELADFFPPQVIDPEVHKLLEEGPGRRRRFLDWGVFHVEPSFLSGWQRYHRALRQRNAALKQQLPDAAVGAWDDELVQSGEALASQRRAYLGLLREPLLQFGQRLLGLETSTVYHPGWPEGRSLQEALEKGLERDRRYKATQYGPHRADVSVQVAGHAAKDRVSRGQQKLLAASLMLAQLEIQDLERPSRSALLLDDPAAELDPESLAKLLDCVRELKAQLIVTSLQANLHGLPETGNVFHVKHGAVSRA